MIALLLTFATFLVFCVVGLGVLTAVRADTSSLRVVLTAPPLGTAALMLPLFVLSHAGVPMASGALPVTIVVLAGAVVVIAWRRPRPPVAAAPVLAICAGGLLLVGWPMLDLGFRWIANANDDMANYVLSAMQLLHHGLLGPLDVEGLSLDTNYAGTLRSLHNAGARPGADVMLAALSDVTGRKPYEVFMPLIISLSLTTVCGAAALAMQAATRWWAASLAAFLLVISPLATFGVVQQLLPQVWGLGLAAALFALLMRRELHHGRGADPGELVVIGILAASIVVAYVELASTVVLAYAVYVGVLAVRREVEIRPILRLWLVPLAIVALVVNTYLIRELKFVSNQASTGLASSGSDSLFGFTLIPSALPGMFGLLRLPPHPETEHLGAFILVSMVLLAAVLAASVMTALRGYAASVALLTYLSLGLVLWSRSSDFGLYKLYMYLQPFLAATVAVWISLIAGKRLLAFVPVLLLPLVLLQLNSQHKYVSYSRDPIDLPNASSEHLLPAFRGFVKRANDPIITVTDNPTLGKLEAASVGTRPLYFISRDLFAGLRSALSERQSQSFRRSSQNLQRLDSWVSRSFDLQTSSAGRVNAFDDNRRASTFLTRGDCVVILPTGSQGVVNRRAMPEGSPDIVMRRCDRLRNLLAFTASDLGEGFYLYRNRRAVSFYQLERDSFYPTRTMAGLGRYVLFRILGPTGRVRLAIDFTRSLRHDGSNRLPPAAVVGQSRSRFDLVGRGSARVISKPIRPQLIGGHSYILLDMGEDGRILHFEPQGIQGLYNRSVVNDTRYLTSYVRDMSLVDDGAYRSLEAPSGIRQFPSDLANPDLEYSGIYEDGWVGEESYVFLAPGGPATLAVRADVREGVQQRLQISVDGQRVFSEAVRPGRFDLRVPVPASRARRRVALHWTSSTPLPAPDSRPVAARLELVGLDPAAGG